jgi:hypothetical protein
MTDDLLAHSDRFEFSEVRTSKADIEFEGGGFCEWEGRREGREGEHEHLVHREEQLELSTYEFRPSQRRGCTFPAKESRGRRCSEVSRR